MSLHAYVAAHQNGFDENMFLESGSRTYVEETGGANFFFVTKGGELVIPKSGSILPSITRRSMVYVAENYLDLKVTQRPVALAELPDFVECGLCGTAAVISPVGKVVDHGKEICSPSGMEKMGDVTKRLYDTMTGIQLGTVEAPGSCLRGSYRTRPVLFPIHRGVSCEYGGIDSGGIAFCDAGTGIGKTYAYLVVGIMFHGPPSSRPVLVSTSSIALQKTVRDEHLPLLSAILAEDGMITESIQAVIRKGKSHYVCHQRLERRPGQLNLRKKNWRAGNALLSLREKLDLDEAPRLSSYNVEAHKLPETARQMFSVTLRAEDIQGLIHDLRWEKYLLAADTLADTSRLFLRKLERPHNPDKRFSEYALLLDAACGHAQVLFTSYAAMSAVKERLTAKDLLWPLFTLGRNAGRTTEQFKASPGSVLLATGAAWEGFDFPGDCVSLLVIPRLPFARPDALKEKERETFPNLHSFIRAIVVPEMQIKLKPGFGRAIRTETVTCVVAILDERSVPGQRYFEDVKTALPDMRITDSLQDVEAFIRSVKGPDYFREGGG